MLGTSHNAKVSFIQQRVPQSKMMHVDTLRPFRFSYREVSFIQGAEMVAEVYALTSL